MSPATPEPAEIQQQIVTLLQETHALMLATVNEDGQPEASYAPYVEHGGNFYIFISELAAHTQNLQRTTATSILLMEKNDDGHAFTRKRLSCRCRVNKVARQHATFETVLRLMESCFGNLISTLKGLGDFQLFELQPDSGNFVAGFGQAFSVEFPLGEGITRRSPNK